MPTKIRPVHLSRTAMVYVRQSTLAQVREHTASTARQYDLAGRARDLGWTDAQIVVIDHDQGHSGASAVGRDGFQSLVATVGLGQAGAIFSLEASRLARASSDWYRLLELCALTDTLVIDEDGIYDPAQYDDRLLLGFKGTMSEAELHWLRARLLGGKLAKARAGALRVRLPTGLIYDPAGQVVRDPDEAVQHAIQLVFDRFADTGSALAVVQHFTQHQLQIPTRAWGGAHDGDLTWEPVRHSRVLAILHNPAYAGAYVYGRTHTRLATLPGEEPRRKGRTRSVAPDAWEIVVQGVYPAYVTWDQFQRNQQRLADNRTVPDADGEARPGAAREGPALLQGLACCGRCGRRMSVRYLADGQRPCYVCGQLHTQFGAPTCQTLRGDGIDAAVARAFLEAVEPAQLAVSLSALEELDGRARQIERQWQLHLERARYEADLARRRYQAVEPELRLVARTLEREWEAKLAEVARLEREAATRPSPTAHLVRPEERQRILAVAEDLPSVWDASTTTAVQRKQLVRCLIADVTLTLQATTIRVAIRWHTDAVTVLEVPRPPRSADARRTAPAVMERIRALAPTHTDAQLATVLNREGYTTGLGGTFSRTKVQWLRWRYRLPKTCPDQPPRPDAPRADGRYSARAAASLLNVDVSTIADWCATGRLDALQDAPHHPRWITLTPEVLAALRKPVRQRKPRHARAGAKLA
jgi:DNA invertase Pin-like site-specific DNA recombinase